MIARLSGKLIYKKAPNLIIDCSGVGYEIQATMSVFSKLPEVENKTSIYTHLSIRDDAHVLFGFISLLERDVFRILIKVNGIGPKLGILILSGMSPEQLSETINNKDTTALLQLPGIGKKTADRLIMELTDKLKLENTDSTNSSQQINNTRKSDAIEALSSLGYKLVEAEKMINLIYTDKLDSEALIRLALQAKLK